MFAQSLSCVQLFCDPMNCRPPGSSGFEEGLTSQDLEDLGGTAPPRLHYFLEEQTTDVQPTRPEPMHSAIFSL